MARRTRRKQPTRNEEGLLAFMQGVGVQVVEGGWQDRSSRVLRKGSSRALVVAWLTGRASRCPFWGYVLMPHSEGLKQCMPACMTWSLGGAGRCALPGDGTTAKAVAC